VERADDADLLQVGKPSYLGGVARRAIEVFTRRYPQVFLQATFIVGTRDETPESLARQVALARELGVDFPALHPVTPVPGTPLYDEAVEQGWLSEEDFEHFDWMTPVLDSRAMSKEQIEQALYRANREFVGVRWLLKGLLSRTPYRRDMYRWFALVSARMAWSALRRRLNPVDVGAYQILVEPHWLES